MRSYTYIRMLIGCCAIIVPRASSLSIWVPLSSSSPTTIPQNAILPFRHTTPQPRHIPTTTTTRLHNNRPSEGDTCTTTSTSIIEIPKHSQSTFWYTVTNKKNKKKKKSTTTNHHHHHHHHRRLPCQPTLDSDGPLPSGSYRMENNSQYGTKRTCLITVALDVWKPSSPPSPPTSRGRKGGSRTRRRQPSAISNDVDLPLAIQNAQMLIDGGFTSFQLAAPPLLPPHIPASSSSFAIRKLIQTTTEEYLYANLIKQTPPSVLSLCNLATRFDVPPYHPIDDIFRRGDVRESVGTSIRNMYGRANDGVIDTLHVGFPSSSSLRSSSSSSSLYVYDVLDVLFDLKREGHVRSIQGMGFPRGVVEEAERMGFPLDGNFFGCNLLHTADYAAFVSGGGGGGASVMGDYSGGICIGNPTAGGLFTEKYVDVSDKNRDRYGTPVPGFMSASERYYYNIWARHQRNAGGGDDGGKSNVVGDDHDRPRKSRGRVKPKETSWQKFERTVLGTLIDIASKHQVSVSSVVLRYSMFLSDPIGGGGGDDTCSSLVAIDSDLGTNDKDDLPFRQKVQDLREVFTFELDDEDLDRLADISGLVPPLPRRNDGIALDGAGFNIHDHKGLWL